MLYLEARTLNKIQIYLNTEDLYRFQGLFIHFAHTHVILYIIASTNLSIQD